MVSSPQTQQPALAESIGGLGDGFSMHPTVVLTGDFSTNTSFAVSDELVLFADPTGKLGKRATGTGIATLDGGRLGAIPDGSASWNTAVVNQLKWNGGSSLLDPVAGRASLGLGSAALANVEDFDSPIDSVFGRIGVVVALVDDYAAFYAPIVHSHTFASLTSTPTTLLGYGITDAEPALGNPGTSGYVLSSTTGGVRSWIAPATGGTSPVSSVFTRIGAIVALAGDYAAFYQPLGSYEVPLTFSQSVTRAANTVTLVGDSASPGNTKYYGTNASGTRGWQSQLVYASLQTASANPTGTTSTSGVMMGLGGVAKITPIATGKVLVTVTGNLVNDTASGAAFATATYGTGTAPANGAAITGTSIGGRANRQGAAWGAAQQTPFSVGGVITGLALGTQIWIDLNVSAFTAGSASVNSVTVTAVELP